MTQTELQDIRLTAERWHRKQCMDADSEYRATIDRLAAQCKRHRFRPRQAIDCDDWKTECIYCGKTGRWL